MVFLSDERVIHFLTMLYERSISREWVDRAVKEPDQVEEHDDGTKHFIKQIPEHEKRWLRGVVNITENPNLFVTAFFDRRLRRKE